MADRVICMMLGSPLTEYSVHLFKQSIQSCTLPSARKPVYRALCIVSLKHSAEYSVWSIQSAYYHLSQAHNSHQLQLILEYLAVCCSCPLVFDVLTKLDPQEKFLEEIVWMLLMLRV